MKPFACLVFFIALLFPAATQAQLAVNNYSGFGGWTELSFEATGYFRVEQREERWWLVDPAGHAFLSKGVNHITYSGDHSPELGYSPYQRSVQEQYGSQSKWADAVVERLKRWGFNTVGAWSSEAMRRQQMPYTFMLNMGSRAGGDWRQGVFPDVFDRRFESMAGHVALTKCQKRRDDMFLIGYFIDNELRWGPDWRKRSSLLVEFLRKDADSAGRKRAHDFLKRRYDSIEALNQAWQIQADTFASLGEISEFPETGDKSQDDAAFLEIVANRYFQVCTEAIRDADPNHLILGCRIAGNAPRPVLAAMGRYCDVVSINTYDPEVPVERYEKFYDIVRRPMMLTEYSFKALDSGLPNTKGAGKALQTQAQRAERFAAFTQKRIALPYMVGYHWFQYTDQPAEGRFDGENSNFGIVNVKDEPYQPLVQAMGKVNHQAEAIHLAGKSMLKH